MKIPIKEVCDVVKKGLIITTRNGTKIETDIDKPIITWLEKILKVK